MSIRLEEIKEAIRREIRKELKIKEGAEKLREVAKDRRSQSNVAVLVKKSNSKIAELKSELQELESQILLTSANTAVNSNGQGELKIHLVSHGYFCTWPIPATGCWNAFYERLSRKTYLSISISVLLCSCRYICIYGVRSDITWREIPPPLRVSITKNT